MPDNATRVTEWLKARKGKYFCQRCVSTGTGVKPVNQVNQIVRPLGNTVDYRYVKTTCSRCGADRKCVAYSG